MSEKGGGSDYAGQSEERGQIKTIYRTGGSAIHNEEANRVKEKNHER